MGDRGRLFVVEVLVDRVGRHGPRSIGTARGRTTARFSAPKCHGRHPALDLGRADRFAGAMAEPTDRDAPESPPLGSWQRTYVATCALAVAVIALLWLLTATCNVPLGSAR